MKPILSFITILAGILLMCMELFIETNFFLSAIGILLGICLVIEGILDLKHYEHGYRLRWKSAWVGIDGTEDNKVSFNLLPFFTIWWKKH